MVASLQALNVPAGRSISIETSSLPGGALRLQTVAAVANTAPSITALTTAGAGTLTGAALLSGNINRTGPSAAFTDTTDTAALIQAAWASGAVNSSFVATYINKTAFAATLAGGSGVTIVGPAIVPANSTARYLVVWTGLNTVSMTSLEVVSNTGLPASQYSSINVTAGTLAAGNVTGADRVVLQSTNATPGAQTVRTAAQMLADTPNGAVGQTWSLRIVNTGAGTFTLTADGGATVTLTGHVAILTNTWVDYHCVFTSATAATFQSVGAGTAP